MGRRSDDAIRAERRPDNLEVIYKKVETVSLLFKVLENRVDVVEGLVDLLPHLGAGQHHFPGHEDEQHNFWLHHPINQT